MRVVSHQRPCAVRVVYVAVGVDNRMNRRVGDAGDQLADDRAGCRHPGIHQDQPVLGLKHHHIHQREVNDPGMGRHRLDPR